ncbi:hypothetical protein [Listeria monocytogenes]|uniref:Uncharacterized protein n=1 Tax=Listeria monocytogenes TaxID=1639 RepID=A0A5M0YS69_LISMN|nr:hypothetical protein [Listeria monocytogenes]EAC7612358.1 hypothetical protein [Listeria monocytogenes]EAD1261573.1 hypothetical protein [Listeria monocytogenes]EAE3131961.1 hypothetical protein [Listeria monocytogenes]EAG7475669.1 hypothetical protein [Listeria monocytogenes]EAH1088485.1 hypothetical protein [Listeria monocytogenes]
MNWIKKTPKIAQPDNLPDLIQVDNLKEYVVDSFEQKKRDAKTIEQLTSKISELEERLKEMEVLKVVLSEKDSALRLAETNIYSLTREVERTQQKLDNATSELNSFKILQDTQAQKNQAIERRAASSAKKEFAKELQNLINDHKGNLSKATVLNYIEQIEDVGIGIYS